MCLVGVVYGGIPVVTVNTLHIGYSPFLGEPLLFFVVRFPKLLYGASGDGRTPLFPKGMDCRFYILVIRKSQVALIRFTSIQLDLFYIWGCQKIKD